MDKSNEKYKNDYCQNVFKNDSSHLSYKIGMGTSSGNFLKLRILKLNLVAILTKICKRNGGFIIERFSTVDV